ncbi:Reverse transcriptase precursor [Phytophthora megakarya]|uniref:Reverse transcriptase n=1 Tax=Phytophthora megakarya TaxID=4795 RepID=A0A225W8K7_9STRA|nr:Reverse transcriptase precursor [Phytophthora megakarya]
MITPVLKNLVNYRPLALLNSDYKILARMLATRVSTTLDTRIHSNQNGFVPNRTIHATLDLFNVAQRVAHDDALQADAITLLLDFHKADDLVDRGYLLEVLWRHGCPSRFITAIEWIHTNVHFLANGSHSRKIAVTSGIHQGYPLTSLLFILALEPLYRRMNTDP